MRACWMVFVVAGAMACAASQTPTTEEDTGADTGSAVDVSDVTPTDTASPQDVPSDTGSDVPPSDTAAADVPLDLGVDIPADVRADVPLDTGGEVCGNGRDDDHDGRVDEGCPCAPGATQFCYPGDPAEATRGSCRPGSQRCEGTGELATWGDCMGAVGPTTDLCGDGQDQDCNGTADDGAGCCRSGTTESCYGGPAGTSGVGVCRAGTRRCAMGAFGECTGAVLPGAEVCGNGADDDCNGATDETCVCTPSATRPCYPGPPGTSGTGPCRSGTQTCPTDGSAWGTCTGAVVPRTEVCGNGTDDDCNGATDETCACTPSATRSCYTGPAGTSGVGRCRTGSQTCPTDGSAWGVCTGQTLPIAEVCGNATDDDCNGVADDGCVCTPSSTRACYPGPAGTEGVGACRGGSQACSSDGSAWGTCTGAVVPRTEVCGNGTDDDCDRETDETCVCTPGASRSCYPGPGGTLGLGRCRAGTETCYGDGSGWGGCSGAVLPASEVCGNGVDEDCDGTADDGCLSCSPATVRWAIPAGTVGGPSCITTGGGYCEAYVTCSGEYCSAPTCGEAHCGTLRCNDGTYARAQYCSVRAICTATGVITTGFGW